MKPKGNTIKPKGSIVKAVRVVLAAIALAVPSLASAATFNVDRTDDNGSALACTAAANDCSLRGAIIASNDLAGSDTIILPAGTYTYLIAMPDITDSVTIAGDGAKTTVINANSKGNVLSFRSVTSNDKTALVSGVTITGGLAQNGAGVLINNYGTVTLRKVTIRDNVGTASGTGTSAGGGILVFPDTLVVENSTLSGNSAFSGGAMFINTFGTVTLTNVTISGNQGLEGAGIFNGGGGVFLTNVTLANNIKDPNFGNAGTGIYNFGTTTLKNTILAENTVQNCYVASGTIVSAGHNVGSDGTCGLTGPGDLSNTDPMLGALQDNGGPTFTQELLPGSPAIDAGDNTDAPATDQRGVPRPQNGVTDIGAYEVDTATPIGSTVEVQPTDTTTGDTPVTLTFDQVNQAGNTSLTTGGQGEVPPTGFKLGNPPTYYNITTSASFTGDVEVCIDFTGVSFNNENSLKLFHFDGSNWVNATTSLDTVSNIICGSVTSLSPFAVFEATDADTTPDQFTFIDVVNVQPNKTQTSNTVTITGINTPAPISVSGGEYQIVNVTGWITTAGAISNGQQVRVRHVSAKPPQATTNTTLTVGGVSDTFSSRTVPKKPK